MRKLPFVALVCACAWATAWGATEAPAPTDSVRPLIARLGSADFAEREGAMRDLAGLGEPALAALRQAQSAGDLEVAHRAAQLVRIIECRLDSQCLLATRHVHLIYKDTPVEAAIAEFNRQTGVTLQVVGDRTKSADQKVTLDTGDVTFWEALDAFCRHAGLVEKQLVADPNRRVPTQNLGIIDGMPIVRGRVMMMTSSGPRDEGGGHDGKFILVPGKMPAVPTFRAGALRVRALPPEARVAGTIPADGETILEMEVTPEPGFAWQGLLSIKIDRAVDDRGQRLVQPMPFIGSPLDPYQQMLNDVILVDIDGDGLSDRNAPGTNPWQVPVRLRLGKTPGRMVKEVHGTLAAQVQTASEPLITVADLPHARGKTIEGEHGGSLTVVDYQREKDGRVRMTLQFVEPARDEELTQPRLTTRMRIIRKGLSPGIQAPAGLVLLDAQGKEYRSPALLENEPGQTANGQICLVFQPNPGQGEPGRLEFRGRRSVVVEVPFTLKDVPLP